jgi:anthranilate synthase/aminodeoxychorismate synthase-like glutamine amidotransferase
MKILFIDNFDSFANTIAAYFELEGAEVIMYKSDCSIDIIEKENPDLILLGPGPNGPKDAGNYMKIIEVYHEKYPIFGICLGFQALMQYFGEDVKRLHEIIHGASSAIEHDGKTIFEGIKPNEQFARYHSLGVYKVPKCFEISASVNKIVMAARHKTLPIEGVQFHPESILSMKNDAGKKLVKNVIKHLIDKKRGLKTKRR